LGRRGPFGIGAAVRLPRYPSRRQDAGILVAPDSRNAARLVAIRIMSPNMVNEL
jgi:hypothetical protein